MFDFEKLSVYQKSTSFADRIYKITARFPKSELFGLTSQLQRAAVSIPCNIAEGVGRDSLADRKRFYYIARGSLYECIPLISIAVSQKYLPQKQSDDLMNDCHEIARMLGGLINSLRE